MTGLLRAGVHTIRHLYPGTRTAALSLTMRRFLRHALMTGKDTMENRSYREKVNQLGLRDLTPKLWGITILLIAEVFFMAITLYFGIDPDGSNRVSTLINGLLGRGYIKSEMLLWLSRLSVIAIIVTVIWA